MKNIRQKILIEFKKLDVFRYTNKEEKKFDRNEIENQVSEELNHHIRGHTYSPILKDQLIDIYGQGFVIIAGFNHPYESLDIYDSIDQILGGQTKPKGFTRETSNLYGKNIYHSHHSMAFYSVVNCIRFFKEMYKSDDDILEKLAKIKKKHPHREDQVRLFAHEVFLESVNWENKTGEWIVYQMKDRKFHFLCLYVHDSNDKNDENLFSIIENHLK